MYCCGYLVCKVQNMSVIGVYESSAAEYLQVAAVRMMSLARWFLMSLPILAVLWFALEL